MRVLKLRRILIAPINHPIRVVSGEIFLDELACLVSWSSLGPGDRCWRGRVNNANRIRVITITTPPSIGNWVAWFLSLLSLFLILHQHWLKLTIKTVISEKWRNKRISSRCCAHLWWRKLAPTTNYKPGKLNIWHFFWFVPSSQWTDCSLQACTQWVDPSVHTHVNPQLAEQTWELASVLSTSDQCYSKQGTSLLPSSIPVLVSPQYPAEDSYELYMTSEKEWAGWVSAFFASDQSRCNLRYPRCTFLKADYQQNQITR